MTHLLDTDHLSILQRRAGLDYTVLVANMVRHDESDIGVCVVSLHEQALGAHAKINGARNQSELLQGYRFLFDIIEDYRMMPLLPFDLGASAAFNLLKAQKVRIGSMDLRLAAVALSRGLILVTRNAQDFALVPGLQIEDWTK